MSEVFNYFIKKTWIGTSIVFGLVFPGLYQIITNNFAIYKEFDIFQILLMAVYISLPTYMALIFMGAGLCLIFGLVKQIFLGELEYTNIIINNIFKFGILNCLIIFLGDYTIRKDTMWKYIDVVCEKHLYEVAAYFGFYLLLKLLYFYARKSKINKK